MCFYLEIKGTYNHIPERAEQDIIVYKMMLKGSVLSRWLKGLESPHQNYWYTSKAKQPFIDIHPTDDHRVYEGYHSYKSILAANSYATSSYAVFKFIIPKGATYFYNSYNEEYVSSEIRVASFKPIKV